MDANAEIQRAKDAASRKKTADARAILRDVLAAEPANVDAWVTFACVAQKPEDALRCLEQAARLDPSNETVQQMLADLQPALPAPLVTEQTTLVSSTGAPVVARRGRTVEIVLLVTLVGIGCCVVALLVGIYLPKLPLMSTLLQAKPATGMDEITAPIFANINASNAEDMDAYMATIHSQSPVYDQTESLLSSMFSEYDLSFEVSKIELLEQTANEAKVAFVLTTRKINGPAFKDNRVTGVMILRPDNGIWKIYNQEVNSIDYLN
jgi:hypothetical protein